jgi:hypothetical protein
MAMNLLLTGAGFSRNWGGWLVDEAFEYLLGCPELDAPIRAELWSDKNLGLGYEASLARLQQLATKDATGNVQARFNYLSGAVARMFEFMDQGFRNMPFEWNGHVEFQVTTFLQRFDAIFTLNQDLLLERCYQRGINSVGDRRFAYAISPGLRMLGTGPSGYDPDYEVTRARAPVEDITFSVPSDCQPYFKLHGSMSWFDRIGGRLLVMGGNKTATIGASPLLNWYAQQFEYYLRLPNTRLMIVGYGFRDEHINAALQAAVKAGLQIFIIDPKGVDILDQRPKTGIIGPPTGLMDIQPNVIGASRRSLRGTFGGDNVEHARVMRFFDRS